jgi:iron complex outermembrane receptor protein
MNMRLSRKGSSKTSGHNLRLTLLSGISLGAMAVAISSPAFAQTDTSSSSGIEEVVVTARHTTENIQDVPLTITAFSSETLKAAGATDLQQISFLTAGLTYTSFGSATSAQPVIRGISDTSGGATPTQNTATFLDGIYISDSSAIDLSLGGLQRVEVVEGPVSGLYGRSAFAGAINYVTARPSADFHTDDAVTVGNDGHEIYEADVSGSLTGDDVLTGRVAGIYNKLDGTFQDPISHAYANGYKKEDVLVSLQFKPDDHITFYPVFYYGHDTYTQPETVTYYDTSCAAGGGIDYCGNLNQGQKAPEAAANPPGFGTGYEHKVINTHFDLKGEYSWGTLDLLAGYNGINTTGLLEFDDSRAGVPFALYAGPPASPFSYGTDVPIGTVNAESYYGNVIAERDTSVEVRYDTPSDFWIRGSIGGYYYNDLQHRVAGFGIYIPGGLPAGDRLNSYVTDNYAINTTGGFDLDTLAYSNEQTGTRDFSGFVGAAIDILPDLTFSTDVRLTDEQAKLNCEFCAVVFSKDFWSLTSNTALTWKPTKDLTAYVSAANGSKAGGFNTPGGAAYSPETDWDYEAGVKTSLLDDHLKLNADVFLMQIQDVQEYGPPAHSLIGSYVVTNYGGLHNKGVEASFDYVDDSGFSLGAGMALVDPRFTKSSLDFSDGAYACGLPQVKCELYGTREVIPVGGNRAPNSSDFTYNMTMGYHHALTLWSGWNWFVRADYRFESKQYSNVSNTSFYGPRNVINFHAGVEDDNWSLTGFVLNLTNDQTPIGNSPNAILNGSPPYTTFPVKDYPTSYLPEGRTYGLRLEYQY